MKYYYTCFTDSDNGFEFWLRLTDYNDMVDKALKAIFADCEQYLLFKATEGDFVTKPDREELYHDGIPMMKTKRHAKRAWEGNDATLYNCADYAIEHNDSGKFPNKFEYDTDEYEEVNTKHWKTMEKAYQILVPYFVD